MQNTKASQISEQRHPEKPLFLPIIRTAKFLYAIYKMITFTKKLIEKLIKSTKLIREDCDGKEE